MLVSKNADVTAIMVNKLEGDSRNMGFLIKPMVRGDTMTMLEVHFAGGATCSTNSVTLPLKQKKKQLQGVNTNLLVTNDKYIYI